MGFWKVLGNMAQGKPGFEAPVDPREQSQAAATQTSQPSVTPAAASGQKVIPTIAITHCKSSINGPNMEVTAWITNSSTVEIELDKVYLLGQYMEIDRRLNPQQAHEVRLYSGRMPTNDSVHKTNIYYKSFRDGDYFCADYMIEYNQEADGAYTIEDLHPENYGVRDV